jgi:signal transduction histidine kinase
LPHLWRVGLARHFAVIPDNEAMTRAPVIVSTAGHRPTSWGVLRFLREPFTRRSWAEFGYAVVGLPMAIAGFVFTIATLVIGTLSAPSFAGLLIGIPVLVASSYGVRYLGAVNRRLAGRMIGLRVAAPPPLRPAPGIVGLVRSALTDVAAWRARAYLVLKLPIAVATFAVAITFRLGAIVHAASPLLWASNIDQNVVNDHGVIRHYVESYGSFYFDTFPRTLILVAQGVVMWLLAPWALRAVLAIDKVAIRGLLGPASLSERVQDLEQTRAHAVDDAAARLRSIERDLHDGAQAQLVALAMKLGLAKEKLGAAGQELDVERARELVETAHLSAKEAITELRDLARGIHPPVLDTGLEAALSTLAARSAVPVDLVVDVPQRPSPAIETIAYFCAAELLTNVAKHSGARHATIEAVHVEGLLRIRVTDDGAGGARARRGGGLAGLADRLRTVDGQLSLSSPRGGPTVVTAELPSHA